MAGVHEDFGEKIGGAKKDLWKDRGLYADDLSSMNEREAEKFVKKDNVWKKPDYAAMLEEGIPLGVVYFIKKARDGLNASPQYYRTDDTPEKRTARQKEYIKTVRELQTVLSDVRTVEDAVRAYDRFFVDNGYLEKSPYVCPWCGGKDVVEGIQSTYAKVQPNKALTLKGENLIHVICKNCGTAVRSYVENPQVLE